MNPDAMRNVLRWQALTRRVVKLLARDDIYLKATRSEMKCEVGEELAGCGMIGKEKTV